MLRGEYPVIEQVRHPTENFTAWLICNLAAFRKLC